MTIYHALKNLPGLQVIQPQGAMYVMVMRSFIDIRSQTREFFLGWH